MSRFQRLLMLGAAVYGVTIILFLLVRWWAGQSTPVELVNRFLPLILMPALVLLPLCLIWRRVRLALLMLPAVWSFGTVYAPLFLPNDPPLANAPRLTLATYNMGARETQIEPLVDNLRALNTDLIAMQEVSQEEAALITQALAESYPFMALHPNDSPYFGYGILSRYPIHEDHAYPIQPDRLRLQRAQIQVGDALVTVFNFHAQPISESWRPPDVMVRRRQVWQLIEEAIRIDGPRLLLGDFNLNEQAYEYQDVIATLSPTLRMPFTRPGGGWASPIRYGAIWKRRLSVATCWR